MGRRKGEFSSNTIDRECPHQIALPAERCNGDAYHTIAYFCSLKVFHSRAVSTISIETTAGIASTAFESVSMPRDFRNASAANGLIQSDAEEAVVGICFATIGGCSLFHQFSYSP
jgi:hypothetical protein